MSYGMRSRIGIDRQDSGDVAVADSMHWVSVLDESIGQDKPALMAEGMRGIYDEGAVYEGPNVVPGEINAEANPISLGVFLRAIMGAETLATSGALVTHTWEPRAADFDALYAGDPLTIHKHVDDAGSGTNFYDMVANEFELSISHGELLKMRLGLVGGKRSQIAPLAASYPSGKVWTWNQGSMQLGGNAIGTLRSLTYKQTEQIEPMHTLDGSLDPSRFKRTGYREIALDGVMVYDNQDQYQDFLAQTEQAFKVNWRGSTEVQSGYYDELTIDVPLFRFGEFKPAAGGPGKIEVSFSGKGVYSVDSATGVRFTLQNTHPEY